MYVLRQLLGFIPVHNLAPRNAFLLFSFLFFFVNVVDSILKKMYLFSLIIKYLFNEVSRPIAFLSHRVFTSGQE